MDGIFESLLIQGVCWKRPCVPAAMMGVQGGFFLLGRIAAMVTIVALPMGLVDGAVQAGVLTTLDLDLNCDPTVETLASFEAWYAQRSGRTGCWAHLGHHQYFVGRDQTYFLNSVAGRVVSVEQHFSPPIEPGGAGLNGVFSPIPIEISMDGRVWERVATVNYQLVPVLSPQTINFDLTTGGEEFRYLRIRQPLSAAQGLSGYIDHSNFTLNVDTGTAVSAPTLVSQAVLLTCATHIMEAIYPGHPCSYGGINHWDAASTFHTYPLDGLATISDIEGVVEVTDNYRRVGTLDFELVPPANATVWIMTSEFGTSWNVVHSFSALFNVPTTFSVTGLSEDARFIRLVTNPHPLWADVTKPSAKHSQGYFVASQLEVTGDLPDTL